ncbi:MAG: hypothetical protein ABIO70_19365 [Pseudomonadota bacterium]
MRPVPPWVRQPRTGLLLLAPLALWAALGSPGRALIAPAQAAVSGAWEDLLLWIVAVLAVVAGVAGRAWVARHPPRGEPRAWPRWVLPAALGLGWALTWITLHALRDPGWVPSGIDWQDSFLDAYAIRYDDPGYYSIWRYPLYPALGVAVARVTGLDLSVALQLVSRVFLIGMAVPLWALGTRLGGRAAAAAGIGMLFALPSVHMLSDAVTPYPMVALLAVSAAAFGVYAIDGLWWAFAGLGVCTAGIFASEPKGLALGLGMVAASLALALLAAGRGALEGSLGRRAGRWLGRLGARLALLLLPTLLAYGWMHQQDFLPVTLEEQAINSLADPTAGDAEKRAIYEHGYVFGHFEDVYTIERTLRTFQRSARNPALANQRAGWRRDSRQRIAVDFPGMTARLPLLALLGLAIPLIRRPPGGRRRWQVALGLLPLGAVLASCVPVISNYQERYLVHGLVLLPILLALVVDAGLRLLLRGSGRLEGPLRVGTLAFLVLAVCFGPSPLALRHLAPRIVPVTMGGVMEVAARDWGEANMQEGDLLLDTSWLMTGLLLAGERPVARTNDSYPPGGAPSPADHWRITQPWPARFDGRFYALVVFIDPQDFSERAIAASLPPGAEGAPEHQQSPKDLARLEPDSEPGRQIVANPSWEEVFRDRGARVRVYRWGGRGVPPGWRLPPAQNPVPRHAPPRPPGL